MKYIVLLGRILYSFIFIVAGPGHFHADHIAYAAAMGLPMAQVLVPASGVLALLGGLSVALGYKAKWGGWALVLFLVPVTSVMHRFWGLSDPQMAMMQQIQFFKNLSMLGGAFLVAHFGSGPLSIKS
jgi:putative oxidoreductase